MKKTGTREPGNRGTERTKRSTRRQAKRAKTPRMAVATDSDIGVSTVREPSMSAETATLRAWAVVDLNAVGFNIRAVRQRLTPSCEIMAVVKADAYGHGVVPVCRAALDAGATWLGVATLGEGIALRLGGIDAPVVVLGGLTAGEVADALAHRLGVSITSVEMVETIVQAVRGKTSASLHLKVDTGMTRLGVFPRDVPAILGRLTAARLGLEGVYTQLACADDPHPDFTQEQLLRFQPVVLLVKRRFPGAIVHAANSAATLAYPRSHYDLVRVGLAMYGLYPADHMRPLVSLRPVMSLYTRVVRTARVGPGTAVSYGAVYRARQATTIATVACGYADGYPRLAGDHGAVLIRGRRHPIAGRVCMDHLMVDVGDDPVAVGEQVQLFGADLSVDDVASWAQTISYEILCGVGLRVPRIYLYRDESTQSTRSSRSKSAPPP